MSVSRRQSRASRLFLDEQSGKSSVREATAGEVSNCPEFPSSQATTMGQQTVWQRVEVSAGFKYWSAYCGLMACKWPQQVRTGNPALKAPEGPGWQGHTEKNPDTRTDHDKNKGNVCLSVKASVKNV